MPIVNTRPSVFVSTGIVLDTKIICYTILQVAYYATDALIAVIMWYRFTYRRRPTI